MSITYIPATNFTAKDSMATTNPDKVLSGVRSTSSSLLSRRRSSLPPSLNPTFTDRDG